jgi:hypothetical protein
MQAAPSLIAHSERGIFFVIFHTELWIRGCCCSFSRGRSHISPRFHSRDGYRIDVDFPSIFNLQTPSNSTPEGDFFCDDHFFGIPPSRVLLVNFTGVASPNSSSNSPSRR